MSYVSEGIDWGDTVPGWKPGATTIFVRAACCPNCGTANVHHKSANGNSDKDISRWYCPRCKDRWKMAEKKTSHASVIG